MIISMLPMSVFAEELDEALAAAEAVQEEIVETPAEETETVASVNGTAYATLEEAIEAAEAGDTVTLLADVTLTASLTIPAAVALLSTEETNTGVTLDLAGKTVSYTSDVMGEAMITNNGTLTINDSVGGGKILYTYTGAADSNYGKGNYTIANNGKLTVDGVTVENATASMKHAFYAIINGNGGEIVLEDGLILNTNNYAVRMFGNGDLTVNGGEIKGTRAVWMQAPGSNTADAPAISLTVNDGKLTATGESADYELAVYSYSYGNDLKNVSVTVKGGEIDGDIALTGGMNKTNAETVTVTGGVINGELYSYAADEVATKTVNVSGGTFTYPVEAVYCADGYIPADLGNGLYSVKVGAFVAQVGTTKYETLQDAENAAVDGDTIVLLTDIKLNDKVTFSNSASARMVTLDMNGKTITLNENWPSTSSPAAFWVCDGLTITGTGTINAAPAGDAWAYAIIVGHRTSGTTDGNSGNLVIENGTFYSDDSSVISVTNGSVIINGGTFEAAGDFDLNCIDDMYAAGKATITVKGGTFVGFNPENNAAEGTDTNFCADDYIAKDNGDGTYSVIPALPTATVTEIENEALTFAMNFKADAATDAQLAYYGDWYADFEFTVTGLTEASVTFNANGDADGWLSGQYDGWSENWVNVPFEDVTLEEGDTVKIMALAAELMNKPGLKFTYSEVYDLVKDFDCGAFFTDEFLANNPDFKVTLKLCMYDPADESTAHVIGETYTFDAPEVKFVAQVGTEQYTTIAAAIEAANANETVTLVSDVTLEKFVTIDKSITLDLGGKSITRDGGNAVIYVNGADVVVTITGEGSITGNQTVWAANGTVKIMNGTFTGVGVTEAVYVSGNGHAEIYGGTFANGDGKFVLNQRDGDRETSSITVYGGTFVGFNPADNAAENAGTNFVADGYKATETDGVWTVAEKKLFKVAGTSVSLNNSLAITFFVAQADLDADTEYTAVVTKKYADGREDCVVEIPSADWKANGAHKTFTFDKIAAKEMKDDVIVVIYDENGNAVSEEYTESIYDYAKRTYDRNAGETKLLTVLTDMVNYGAAAQVEFNYGTDDLASADFDQAYASTGAPQWTDKEGNGGAYKGASLILEDNIVLRLWFADVASATSATITYTDHYGNAKNYTTDIVREGSYIKVNVDTLVVVDGETVVTCKLMDANGVEVGYASDSIAYIAARNNNATIYAAIEHFSTSAREYFAAN